MSLNKVMLIGRLGSDPQLRYTQGGQAVANFNIATNERWTDKSGQQQERTEWHKIVVWGRQGENCEKYLSKGRNVFIEGRMQTREWEDKEGGKRKTTEIVAQNVQFLDGGGDGASRPQGQGQGPSEPTDSGPSESNFDQSFSDDEIPF